MDINEQILAELQAIRRTQEESLAEYRRVNGASMEMQREAGETQQKAIAQQVQAIAMSARHARQWRMVVAVAAVVVGWMILHLYRLDG